MLSPSTEVNNIPTNKYLTNQNYVFYDRNIIHLFGVMLLQYIILLFLCSIKVNCSQMDKQTIQALITETFRNDQCIYLITDPLHNFPAVVEIVATLELQIVSCNIDKVLNLRNLPFSCFGYIISSSNFHLVNKILSLKRMNTFLKPHSPAIVFLKDTTLLNLTSVRMAAALHDLNLTVIDNEKMHLLVHQEVWNPPNILAKFKQKLCVAVFHCPPFIIIKNQSNLMGVEIDMLKTILKNWPVTYTISSKPSDSSAMLWGSVLKKVTSNVCDLATCSQWLTLSHKFSTESTDPYTSTCRNLLVQRSKLLPPAKFLFYPFKTSLWLTFFLVYVTFSCLLCLFSNVLDRANVSPSYIKRDLTLAFLYTLRIYSSGASKKIPESQGNSLKLVVLIISIFCSLLCTYYCSGMTILLRFPPFSKQINSINDAIESNIKWMDASTWLKTWMLHTSNDKLIKFSSLFELCTSISEQNKKLRQENYATLVETPPNHQENFIMLGEHFDGYNRKRLKLVKESIACFQVVFPMKVNSPYVKIFNNIIARLIEAGFIDYWFSVYVNRPEYRFMKMFFQEYSHEIYQTMDLVKLKSAFYILVVGFLMAFVVLCFECFFGSRIKI